MVGFGLSGLAQGRKENIKEEEEEEEEEKKEKKMVGFGLSGLAQGRIKGTFGSNKRKVEKRLKYRH